MPARVDATPSDCPDSSVPPTSIAKSRKSRKRRAKARDSAGSLPSAGAFPNLTDADLVEAFEEPGSLAHRRYLEELNFFD